MLEHDHIRLRRDLESVLGELNSIPADKDPGDVYLERATEIVVAIENEALACLESWNNFTSLKNDDVKFKDECIKELINLIDDISRWFVNGKYEFIHSISRSFEFNREQKAWNIRFDGEHFNVKHKSGLIQLASLLMNPNGVIDLENLPNNVVKPDKFGSGDKSTNDELSRATRDGGGVSVDIAKSKNFGNEMSRDDIVNIYKVLDLEIEKILQSNRAYVEKHEEIDDMLEHFAKYIGMEKISLKKFKDKYFLKNILGENKRKNTRKKHASKTSAKAVEKAMRRCIDMFQKFFPSFGDHLASNVQFRHGNAYYENTDGNAWKIRF